MMNLSVPRLIAKCCVPAALLVLAGAAVAGAQFVDPLSGGTAPGDTATSRFSEKPSAEIQAVFDEGKQLFDAENYDEAISKLTQAINMDAADLDLLGAEPYLLRAQAYLALEEYEDAIKSFGESVFRNPNLAEAYNGLGMAYRDSLQIAEAYDNFKKAVELDRQNKDYLFNLGSAIVDSGQTQLAAAAEKLLTKVISIDDTMAEAYSTRGRLHVFQGKFEEAVADFARAIELEPTDRDNFENLGVSLIQMEEFDKAIAAFTGAFEADQAGPATGGEETTEEEEEDDSVYVAPLLARAQVFAEIGKRADTDELREKAYQAAIADCQQTIEMLQEAPLQLADVAMAHLQQGAVYHAIKRYEDAVRSLSEALRINPGLGAGALVLRGIAWFHLGDDELALADLDEAVQINLNDPRPHLWRGFALVRQRNYREAIAAYTRALEVNDQFEPALNNRGLAYVRDGQYDKAIEDFNDLLRINPKDQTAYFKRGVTYMLKEDYEKAIIALSRATQLDSFYADAHQKLGDSYALLGQADSAQQHRDLAARLRVSPEQ